MAPASDFATLRNLTLGGAVRIRIHENRVAFSETLRITRDVSIHSSFTATFTTDGSRRLFAVAKGARLELRGLVLSGGIAVRAPHQEDSPRR